MNQNYARQTAAQAWCTPETSDRVMDPALAEAFANILIRMMPIPAKDDEGWLANLTMACIDEGCPRDIAERAAERFMGWLTMPDIPELDEGMTQ